jgi:hypothetical protein
MKILHILTEGPTRLSTLTIEAQREEHEMKVIDLKARVVSYGDVVDDIFSYDRVISW